MRARWRHIGIATQSWLQAHSARPRKRRPRDVMRLVLGLRLEPRSSWRGEAAPLPRHATVFPRALRLFAFRSSVGAISTRGTRTLKAVVISNSPHTRTGRRTYP
jgi:hypothetical protein